MKNYAIIVAGGLGTRMKSELPKQFLLIDGVPIIVHSIQKFLDFDSNISIVVVLPQGHIEQWVNIKSQFLPDVDLQLATGGDTRTQSVMSGLALLQEEGLVAIHDAVRPFVSVDTIASSFESAQKSGSGVAVVALKDSIRETDGNKSIARDRSNYVLVQTPQTFKINELKDAYAKVGTGAYTDDASVYEAAGNTVSLVDGSYENIKITTPEDLK